MNKYLRIIVILILAGLLALLITAVTQSLGRQASQLNGGTGASHVQQVTPTPQPVDRSEIGSTDGIVVLGGVIALIVLIPILARRRYWVRQPSH